MPEPRDPAGGKPETPGDPVSLTATPGTELRTFLIADIRGYTAYTASTATMPLQNWRAFAESSRRSSTPTRDFLLELRGDEALVVFVSARKALRAAVELQARFEAAGCRAASGSAWMPARHPGR